MMQSHEGLVEGFVITGVVFFTLALVSLLVYWRKRNGK